MDVDKLAKLDIDAGELYEIAERALLSGWIAVSDWETMLVAMKNLKRIWGEEWEWLSASEVAKQAKRPKYVHPSLIPK